MSVKQYINYDDIINHESIVIDFLVKNSDFFSVTVVTKKPHSQMPPAFDYNKQLEPFIIKYIFDKENWLVNFLGNRKHQIMVICRCCRESNKQLLQMSNVFLPIDNDMPEDICFYKKNKLWFATISHEKIAFIENATSNDIAFFKNNHIRVSD